MGFHNVHPADKAVVMEFKQEFIERLKLIVRQVLKVLGKVGVFVQVLGYGFEQGCFVAGDEGLVLADFLLRGLHGGPLERGPLLTPSQQAGK